MQSVIAILAIYLIAINLVGYVLMGNDKQRAIQGAWRIPERTLFLVALIGGSVGSILGMQHFRHKTKHLRFQVGMPLILIAQMIAGIWLMSGLS